MSCSCQNCNCTSDMSCKACTCIVSSQQVQALTCVKFFLNHPKAKLPTREHGNGNAGYDVYSVDQVVVPAGGRALVPTGLHMAIDPNWYCRIAPRSGLAHKHGLDVGAGVIDACYRGPIGVVMFNFGKDDYTVSLGERIAQFIFTPYASPEFLVVGELDDLGSSQRGQGAYGSTGTH